MVRQFALVLALLCTVTACGPMKARTEHAAGTDFSSYKTYRWITEDLVLIQHGIGDKRIRTQKNEQRIRAAVERGLESKGITKREGDAAGLIVAFTVGTKVRYALQGASNYDIVEHEPPATVTRATLRLYLFDAATKKQVWEAWTSKSLSGQEDPDQVVNAAVDLLLKKFPPS